MDWTKIAANPESVAALKDFAASLDAAKVAINDGNEELNQAYLYCSDGMLDSDCMDITKVINDNTGFASELTTASDQLKSRVIALADHIQGLISGNP